MAASNHAIPFGHLLREWRGRRRLSQLNLALDAGVSAKHLSFVETGRAQPSREMVLHLAERLDVPLRERNALLLAAGFAPIYRERPLSDPALAAARAAIEQVLKAHEPNPALAVDRHWNLVAANRMVPLLMSGGDAALLAPPINVLRLSLHPRGLAPRIVGFAQWRAHVLARLAHQVEVSADPALVALLEELRVCPSADGTPYPGEDIGAAAPNANDVVMSLRLNSPRGVLSFFTTITVFGTPVDITLSELAIESFFPADDSTARALRELAAATKESS